MNCHCLFVSQRMKVGVRVNCVCVTEELYTEKKENQIFLIFKEIQNGAVAKSYMTDGLLIYGDWGNIYAFHHTVLGSPSSYMTLQLLHSEFTYICEENLIFFLSV